MKNHCKMFDNVNSFFIGVMDEKNFKVFREYREKGKELEKEAPTSGFSAMGLLSVQLKDSERKLLEVWVNSLNEHSYDVL